MIISRAHSVEKSLIFLLAVITATKAAFYYPNPTSFSLEHLLVDTHGAHRSGFADAITPCSNYVSGSQNFGRETAAQWLRVAFHDFVTADVESGTGGVDASIGFETLREENSGSAFNDSFSFWRPYVSGAVSTADLIALSVTMSISNCGGPIIPLRPGRVDATGPGASGVPAPETSLEETLEFFAGAGFDKVDSIKLTACGHTMGSVHHGGFPTVVGPEAVTPNNTAGGIHFDSTVDVFDPLVVSEYLSGTGNAGGPLVTSFNESSRSDLRLYESDNNATMISLKAQGEDFQGVCREMMRRMVETVPKNVVLGDAVEVAAVKPINASLDFDASGGVVFKGAIRILTPASGIPPKFITLATSASSTTLRLTPEPETGYSIYGTTSFFTFSKSISNPQTFTSFTVIVSGKTPNIFPVRTSAFVVPSLTSTASTNSSTTVDFTLAIRTTNNSYKKRLLGRGTSTSPIVNIQAPVGQQGTLGPAIKISENVKVSNVGTQKGYYLWKGKVDVGSLVTGAVSVALLDEKGDDLDILFV